MFLFSKNSFIYCNSCGWRRLKYMNTSVFSNSSKKFNGLNFSVSTGNGNVLIGKIVTAPFLIQTSLAQSLGWIYTEFL